MAKKLTSQQELELLVPQSDPFFNDLRSIAISGKLGGTPMVSQNGKFTISQFLCINNGIETKFTSSSDSQPIPL